MKYGQKILIITCTSVLLGYSASADPQINLHTEICVTEGGERDDCFCTATAIRTIGSGDEQYVCAIKVVQSLGHAEMMRIYGQAMVQNPNRLSTT